MRFSVVFEWPVVRRLCYRVRRQRFGVLLFFVAGCTTLTGTPVSTPPSLTQIAVWENLAPGFDVRLDRPNGEGASARLLSLRIDPAQYTFRVHYQPGEPLSAVEWRDAVPGAVAFINVNFFDPQHIAQGLLVQDGIVQGMAYQRRGGIFAVQDGVPRVRSTQREPYLGEVLEQAVQAFPMLVLDGAQSYTNTRGDRRTRRTAIAQDADGRIVMMATTFGGTLLSELSRFLATSDMNLVNAFNLDGGGSTMMYFNADGSDTFLLPSFDRVPAILAVYKK
ncbi:MAG: phosphodiester glycosidase family protein [Chloroflexi bacterium]|nr:MAG: phosphodiester glycosidase family protein [Chloroflexota bacterium]